MMSRSAIHTPAMTSHTLDARRPYVVPAILTAATLAVFFDVLFLGSYFCFRDSANFFPGIYQLVRDVWAEGSVPLWNPLLNGGQPLAALNVAAVFYPVQLLTIWALPPGTDINASMICHVVLAASGAYVMARDQQCSRVAAGIAALSYGGSGCILFHIYAPNMLAGAAWFAWGMRYGSLLLGTFSPVYLLGFSVSLSMAILGGDPQAVFHAAICLALLLVIRKPLSFQHRGQDAARATGTLVTGGLLAAALAFVQIALTHEFMATTTRYSDSLPLSLWQVPRFFAEATEDERWVWYAGMLGRAANVNAFYGDIYRFSVAPWRLLECLSPTLSGPFLDRWPARHSLEGAESWVATLYAGVLPLACVVAAVWNCRGRPAVRGWTLVLAFAYLASLGGFGAGAMIRHVVQRCHGINPPTFYQHGDEVGGVYWFLVTFMPGYAGFRYPAKWLPPFALAFAQLAALGFHDLVHSAGNHRRVLPAVILLVTTTTAVATAAGGNKWFVIQGGMTSVLAASLAWYAFHRSSRGADSGLRRLPCQHLLLCITAVDLVIAGRLHMHNAPFETLRDGGPVLAHLQSLRRPSMASVHPTPRLTAIDGRNAVRTDSSPMDLAFQTGLLMRGNTPLLHAWGKFGEPGTVMEADMELLCSPLPSRGRETFPRRTFDLASVEFFVISNGTLMEDRRALAELRYDWADDQKTGKSFGIAPGGAAMEVVEASLDGRPTAVYVRNESALPRVRVVRDIRYVPPMPNRPRESRVAFLANIAFPNRRLASPATMAVVESEKPLPPVPPSESIPSGAADSCRIIVDDSRRVVIETNLRAPGLVILADTFHPDWLLSVASDGQPPRVEPILRVNRIHRGCLLPAGQHVLEFHHRSRTFERAMIVSGVAWISVLIAVAWLRRPRHMNAA